MCDPLAFSSGLGLIDKRQAEEVSSSTHISGTLVGLRHHESKLYFMIALKRRLQPTLCISELFMPFT